MESQRMISQSDTVKIAGWVERMRLGDRGALNELFVHFERRLRMLTRSMLRDFPGVHRWEQTDDVYQKALLRLRRALQEVAPGDTQAFFGLAALQIRRELLSLAKHYRSQLSPSRLEMVAATGAVGSRERSAADVDDPGALAEWAEFHEAAAALPEPERKVFELLWYHDLPQKDAAAILGVCVGTVKKRWRAARHAIHETLGGALPGW
jgi:RNA polymerase sigma factor (sigma-70 family)